MRTVAHVITIVGFTSWLIVGEAEAQEPKKPKKADRYQVDPDLAKKFEEQANRPYVAVPEPTLDIEAATAVGSNRVAARLLSMSDQSVLVAVKLTPDQKAALSELWPVVLTPEEADHQTILGDEVCLRYPVSVDFDLHRLDARVGQVLELEIGTTSEQRPIVLFVRGS